MLVVGLTGGIASGKSEVARYFAALGVTVIDADIVAREVVAPGTALLAEVLAHFGQEYAAQDGTLDRTKLRQYIFKHPKEREYLESLLHPAIRQAMQVQLQQSTSLYAVLVIPLLIEVGEHPLVDRILVVDCDEQLQLTRACQRDQSQEEQIKRIIASQATRAERLEKADDVLSNDGTLASLEKAITNLHEEYSRAAKAQQGSNSKES